MISCVYQIRNLKNGKIYIGSTKNFQKRKLRHIQCLKNNYHHNIHLQRSYNKTGLQNFVFEILEECLEKELFTKEKYWIKKINPDYNIGGVGGGDNYTNNPNKINIQKKILKGLEKAWLAEKPNIQKELNPNWRGGKTFFKCPICGVESRITGAIIPKTCYKCRNRDKEKNPFYGKSHTEKTKRILREQRIGKPNIHSSKRCSINGEVYQSASQASKTLNIKPATLIHRLKSKNEKFKNWYYL